jgi:hypothetical protein
MRNWPWSKIILGLGLYLISTGISAFAFNQIGPSLAEDPATSGLQPEQATLLDIAPDEPRTQACPLNGQLFTKPEEEAWEERRPLFIMIENHLASRPQSGLINADIIYEAVAEGGITRFGALFYCDVQRNDTTIAPVRSARTYFLDWASEYNFPLYVHVGGANCSAPPEGACTTDVRAQSLEQIHQYGWGGSQGNDMNQFSIGYPTFWRNYSRLGKEVELATEHTMETTTERLWAVAKKRGWTNISPDDEDWQKDFQPWEFLEEKEIESASEVTTINYEFWSGYSDFAVKWDYDQTSNIYKRTMGGEPHMDNNGQEKQMAVSNVIILFQKEIRSVDDHKHILYGTIGTGKALIFNQGQVIDAVWTKDDRLDRTVFTTRTGKEIKLVPGKIWLSILATGSEVEY